MSSAVLDPTHIDLIVVTAIHGPTGLRSGPPWVPPRVDELLGKESHLSFPLATAVGRALLAANIELVEARLRARGERLPLSTPDPRQYEWTDLGLRLTIPEALKALDAYEDGEVTDYRRHAGLHLLDVGAVVFCARLRAALIRQIPGYADAPRIWTAELALSVAPRRTPPDDFGAVDEPPAEG